MQSQFFENMKIIKDLIGQLSVFFLIFITQSFVYFKRFDVYWGGDSIYVHSKI